MMQSCVEHALPNAPSNTITHYNTASVKENHSSRFVWDVYSHCFSRDSYRHVHHKCTLQLYSCSKQEAESLTALI